MVCLRRWWLRILQRDIRIAVDNARFGVPIARLGLPTAHREMRDA
jgi:hypothetical protein